MPPKKPKVAPKAAASPDLDADMEDAQATNAEDVAMDNAAEGAEDEEQFMIGDEDPNVLKIRILPGESETAASYEFQNEDHTLGNALRHVIMKNPDVEFCGYSIPHPSDPKMNLRIQTYEDADPLVSPHAVLDKGLDDLMGLCDVVSDKFESERDRYASEGRKKDVATDR